MKVSGRRHCGDISCEAEVTPGEVAICHCRDFGWMPKLTDAPDVPRSP